MNPRSLQNLKRGGQLGRQKGVPNKATVEAKEVCSRLVDDPVYRQRLQQRLIAGKLAPAVECMLWHYAKGKPIETVRINPGESKPWVVVLPAGTDVERAEGVGDGI